MCIRDRPDATGSNNHLKVTNANLQNTRSSIVMYKQRTNSNGEIQGFKAGADNQPTGASSNNLQGSDNSSPPIFSKQPTNISNDNSSITNNSPVKISASESVNVRKGFETENTRNNSNGQSLKPKGPKPILKKGLRGGGLVSPQPGQVCERIDSHGNPILKGGKKHKINMNENGNKVHVVESLKKYNADDYVPPASCSCSLM
eukprot:TRINITY_DN16568_c0_g1_i1.p1 TRINITY_DN16568_c0_g1~~TRINITY_DN16568_c0_g1_i1.p1  ORF type:complete len:222 (-),score=55.97 TRINITY_DN16568_c0_g1_i1:176-781(-)